MLALHTCIEKKHQNIIALVNPPGTLCRRGICLRFFQRAFFLKLRSCLRFSLGGAQTRCLGKGRNISEKGSWTCSHMGVPVGESPFSPSTDLASSLQKAESSQAEDATYFPPQIEHRAVGPPASLAWADSRGGGGGGPFGGFLNTRFEQLADRACFKP